MSKQTLEIGNLFLSGFNTNGGGLSLLDLIHPVGSIFETTSSNFATVAQVEAYFGGTWQRFAEGEVSVGYKQNDSDFGTINKEAGSKSVNLTTEMLPGHTHTIDHSHTVSLSGYTGSPKDTSQYHFDKKTTEIAYARLGVDDGSNFGVSGYAYIHQSDGWHKGGSLDDLSSNDADGYVSLNHSHDYDHVHDFSASKTVTYNGSTGSQGSGAAHSNLQPYIVTYKYVRIA